MAETIYDEVHAEAVGDWLDSDECRRPWGWDRVEAPEGENDDWGGAYVTCLDCYSDFAPEIGCDCWEPAERGEGFATARPAGATIV